MTEQSTQEGREMPVQKIEKPRRKRTPEEKVGRQKYHEVLTKRLYALVEQLVETQRVILNGLKGAGYFRFTVPLLQRYATGDEVDVEIIERIKDAGLSGVFPKHVAASLQQYKLQYYDVSRRIVRMNKRLKLETGEGLFEKRGHKWALTRFAFEVYGADDISDSMIQKAKNKVESRL